jgi:hypothetical protein
MDEYMFRQFVDECRVVEEVTTYIEIFNYSVRHVLTIQLCRILQLTLASISRIHHPTHPKNIP